MYRTLSTHTLSANFTAVAQSPAQLTTSLAMRQQFFRIATFKPDKEGPVLRTSTQPVVEPTRGKTLGSPSFPVQLELPLGYRILSRHIWDGHGNLMHRLCLSSPLLHHVSTLQVGCYGTVTPTLESMWIMESMATQALERILQAVSIGVNEFPSPRPPSSPLATSLQGKSGCLLRP